MMAKQHLPWLVPLLLMLAILPWTPAMDLSLSAYFYDSTAPAGKHFWHTSLTIFMYRYGVLLCWPFAIAALVVLCFSRCYSSWRRWRFAALAYFITLAVGPGLLVHVALKDSWNRPRPVQTEQFSGEYPFRALYAPDFSPEGKEPRRSFPSGHASAGFVFISLFLSGRRYHCRWLSWGGLALAIFWGSALAATRIAQGGHYLSDILATAVLIWLVAYLIDRWLARWYTRLS